MIWQLVFTVTEVNMANKTTGAAFMDIQDEQGRRVWSRQDGKSYPHGSEGIKSRGRAEKMSMEDLVYLDKTVLDASSNLFATFYPIRVYFAETDDLVTYRFFS